MKKTYTFLTAILCLSISVCIIPVYAGTTPKSGKNTESALLRYIMPIEARYNTLSNIILKVSNSGANANSADGTQTHSGCVWPRNSSNSYIYGQGIGFAAKKRVGDSFNKLITLSYNPNNASTNMVPGRIEDGNSWSWAADQREKYQVFISTEFDKNTGKSLDTNVTKGKWPNWISSSGLTNRFGLYNYINNERDNTHFPLGPAIVSDEDISIVFKDTDLSKYAGQQNVLKDMGYPMQLQYEQTVYTWNKDQYKDIVIIYYRVINMSIDTLRDCWLAPLSDNDIADSSVATSDVALSNDLAKYYDADTTLNLGMTWTQASTAEAEKKFGYVGISLLMTPAVKSDGFLRSDKNIYQPSEQLGLKTFELFPLESDSVVLNDFYGFIGSGKKTSSIPPCDIRLLFSTGPFNMLPGDTAKLFLMYNFALPSKGSEADGTNEDASALVDQVKLGRTYFYNYMLAKITEQENEPNSDLKIISVYPNPASNFIRLDLNKQVWGEANLEIMNLIGQKVYSSNNLMSENGANSLNLNLGSLQSGNYLIKLSYKGQVTTKMFSIVK